MNTKQIVTGVVALVVAIVITISCAIPVISDSTVAEDTFTNNGYYFMNKIDEGTAITVSWDYQKPTILTVNSEDVALPDKDAMSTIPFTIFCSQSWFMRYGFDSTDGYYVATYQNANTTSYSGNVTSERSLTMTVTDAGVTTVNNGTEHTWSNATGDFFVIAEEGNYVMKKMNESAYVLGDSYILGYGRTYARSYNYTSHLEGSVDDGITGTFYPESTIETAGWNISDVTLDSASVSGYDDLYRVSAMTYEITGENIQPYTAVFSQFIVPHQVTAERTYHPDSTLSTIINVIPVLLIVSIIIGAVALFISNRRD